jgi:glycosyltransferase involved in cell wall biosynthesis
VPSTRDREYLISRLGIPPERAAVCFTGVSADLFELRRTESDRGLQRNVRVLFLGSWLERKGVYELVMAWRQIAAEVPHIELTVAGIRDADVARANLEGLTGVHVIETLSRSDLPRLLASHDVFVLPSWFEGMPLSLLEAAAAGLPCVVSAVCGNLDFFRPEDPQRDGGILVPAGDVAALRDGLMMLINDRQLRVTLGTFARARAREFTWARTSAQALDAYAVAQREIPG